MADQTFVIDVLIPPEKAEAGVAAIDKSLEQVEAHASALRKELVEALSARDQGVTASLRGIEQTLLRSESLANNTQRAIFHIAENVDDRGIRRASDEIEGLRRRAVSLRDLFLGIFAGISVRRVTSEFRELSDEFTSIRNRLSVVTDGTDELEVTYQKLLAISNETRASLEGTALIYQRLAVNQAELGVSTERLFKFTERLNQAIAIAGLTGEEARNGLIQLSQGLASGALRGDELRSVLEQLPPVAKLIAKELNVPVGSLRDLGKQGAITTTVIIDALTKADDVAAQFADTVPTISQAFTVLRNKAIDSVGGFNEATHASQAFSEAVIFASDHVPELTVAIGLLSAELAVGLAAVAAPKAIAALKTLTATTSIANPAFIALGVTLGSLAKISSDVSKELEGVAEAQQGVELDSKFAQTGTVIRQINQEIKKLEEQIKSQAKRGVEASEGQIQALERLRARLVQGKTAAREEADASREAAAAKIENSDAVRDLLAKLEREGQLLQKSAEEQEVQKDLAREITALKKQGIDLDEQKNASLRAQVEAQIRANVEDERLAKLLRDLRKPTDDLTQSLEDLQRAREKGLVSPDDFEKFQKQLEARANKAEQKREDPFAQQVRSLEQANEELKIRNTLEGQAQAFALAELSLRERGVTLTKEQREQLEKLTTEGDALRIESLAKQINLTAQLAEQERDLIEVQKQHPELADETKKRIEELHLRILEASTDLGSGFERAFIKLSQEANDFASAAEASLGAFVDNTQDALFTFLTEGEFRLKDFLNSLARDLLQVTTRLIALQLITGAIGGGSALGGLLGLGAGGLNAGRAGGGTVQPGQKPFPVGELGTELFVPNQTGTIVPAASAAAAAPQVSVAVIQVTDAPGEVERAMSSGRFDRVFVQRVSANKQEFKQVTGS